MKKLFVILLAVAMMVTTLSVTAFAAEDKGNVAGDVISIDIGATYTAGGTAAEIVSVDVEWGTMTFEYKAASTGTWDPGTHSYKDKTEASWAPPVGNNIKVTNHSNTGVTATFAFSKLTGVTDEVSGTFAKLESDTNTVFSGNVMTLATAEGTEYTSAPNGTVYLTLGGSITQDYNETDGYLGTVTITIANN